MSAHNKLSTTANRTETTAKLTVRSADVAQDLDDALAHAETLVADARHDHVVVLIRKLGSHQHVLADLQ